MDASLHLGANFELKGEYIHTGTGATTSERSIRKDGGCRRDIRWPGLNLDLPFINNLELVNRYDRIHDGLGNRSQRYTIGYIYYLSNTLLFEGDYEFLHSNDPIAAQPTPVPAFLWVLRPSY